MPELPEVETTVRFLRKKVLGRTLINLWTDFPKNIKKPKPLEKFEKEIKGLKIIGIRRRAKNILIDLNDKVLLIHQKMTGHLLYGKWEKKGNEWISQIKGSLLTDSKNYFIHLIFFFENGYQLALSDVRKFAKIELWDKEELKKSKGFKSLGPEPLEKNFTYIKFKQVLNSKKGKIKQVLMDQSVIAGIGNIYSDEILYFAKVHPEKTVPKLSEIEKKNIYTGIKKILTLAVKLQGESFSDYRKPDGKKGFYDKARKVYRKEGENCPSNCGGKIKRIKVGQRSAHFCPKCQKL